MIHTSNYQIILLQFCQRPFSERRSKNFEVPNDVSDLLARTWVGKLKKSTNDKSLPLTLILITTESSERSFICN